MNALALPFATNQKIVVPSGTQQTTNGVKSQTMQDMTVTVRKCFTGYIEIVAGSMVTHPPLIIGIIDGQVSVYEASTELLHSNGIDLKHSLLEASPKVLVV